MARFGTTFLTKSRFTTREAWKMRESPFVYGPTQWDIIPATNKFDPPTQKPYWQLSFLGVINGVSNFLRLPWHLYADVDNETQEILRYRLRRRMYSWP